MTGTRWRLALLALVVLHVGAALVTAARTDFSVGGEMITGDNVRYREIAESVGSPYRDYAVEFPPVTLAYVEAVAADGDRQTTGRLLVLTQLLCDLVVAAALAWAWGRRAAVVWLALLVPFLWDGWIFARVDLLAVALTVTGLALVERQRPGAGGAVLAVAVFAKVWPIALVPWLLVRGQRRALVSCALTGALGGALWLAAAGVDGPRQVASFRGASGWQIESVIGSLELVLTGHLPFGQANALRIGLMGGLARALLTLALVAGVAGSWWLAARARRRGDVADAVELGAVTAVIATLVLAPIISPQYLVWVVPFVALVGHRRSIVAVMAAAMVATAVLAHTPVYRQLADGAFGWELVLVARNALLVAVAVLAIRPLLSSRSPSHRQPAGVSAHQEQSAHHISPC